MRPGAASALDTQRRFARAGDAGPGTWASAWRVAVHSRHARVSAHGPHRPARPRPPSDSLPPPIYTCAPRPRRSPFWGSLKCPSKRRLHEPFLRACPDIVLSFSFFSASSTQTPRWVSACPAQHPRGGCRRRAGGRGAGTEQRGAASAVWGTNVLPPADAACPTGLGTATQRAPQPGRGSWREGDAGDVAGPCPAGPAAQQRLAWTGSRSERRTGSVHLRRRRPRPRRRPCVPDGDRPRPTREACDPRQLCVASAEGSLLL